jgi:type VI secretion system secreted protein Hcp
MKTLLRNLLVAVFITVAVSTQALAQTAPTSQFFLKVQGIPGESRVVGHEDEIDVFSFKLGVTQRGVTDFGGGASAGKSVFLPVIVYKNVDISSPQFFLACATGKHIPKVELKAARLSNDTLQEYLVITLTDVLVSSLNHESADASGNQTVLESVSFNYAKIEISYKPQNPDGSLGAPVMAGYDVKANKKL